MNFAHVLPSRTDIADCKQVRIASSAMAEAPLPARARRGRPILRRLVVPRAHVAQARRRGGPARQRDDDRVRRRQAGERRLQLDLTGGQKCVLRSTQDTFDTVTVYYTF